MVKLVLAIFFGLLASLSLSAESAEKKAHETVFFQNIKGEKMAINFNSQGIPLSLKVFLSETGWKEQDKASPLDFVFIVKKAEEDLWFVLFTAFDKKGKGHEIFIPCETESSCVSIVGSHSQVNLKEHLAFLAEVKKKE